MTTPHQSAPDGAVVVGGSAWNYGQLVNEDRAREQFEIDPPSNIVEAVTLLPTLLHMIPHNGVKAWQKWLNSPDEEVKDGTIVQRIMDSLDKHPFKKLKNRLFHGLQGTEGDDDPTDDEIYAAAAALRLSVDDANAGLLDVVTAGSNLIKNSDFERGSSGQPLQGLFSNEQAYSGTQSLKMLSDGAGKSYSLISVGLTPKSIPSNENDVYYVEVMVRGADTNIQTTGGANGVRLVASPFTKTGTALTDQYRSLTADTSLNGTWTKLSGYVQMPLTTAKVQFSIQLSTSVANGSIFYFDSVIVREVTLAKQALDGVAGATDAANTAVDTVDDVLKSGSNVLKNADFERGNAQTGGTFVTSPIYSGSNSLRLVGPGSAISVSYPLLTRGVTPMTVQAREGDVFYLEVMVYGDTANVQTTGGTNGIRMVMSPTSRNGTALADQYISLTASTALNGSWTKMSGYVTMPADSVKASVTLQLRQSLVNSTEKYYFDQVVCREVTVAVSAVDLGDDIVASGSNIVRNGDFEKGISTQPLQGTITTEDYFLGSRCLKMVGNGTGKEYALVTAGATPKTIQANAGDVFYVEVMVRGAVGNTQYLPMGPTNNYIRLNIAPSDKFGAALTNQFVYIEGGTALLTNSLGWYKMSGYLVMPTGTVKAQISLQLTSGIASGEGYLFDNVIVRECTVAKAAQDTATTANAAATTATTNVQAVADNVHQAVNGGSSTGNALSTIKTNLQNSWSNIFDGVNGTSGSSGKTPADVKAAASTLKLKVDNTSTDHNTLVDNVTSGWLGDTATGATLSQALTAMQNSRKDLEANTTAIARIRSKKSAASAKGSVYSVDFSQFSTVALAGFTVTYSGNLSNTIVINNGVAQWNVVNSSASDAKLIHSGSTATDFQSVRGTMSAPPQVPSGTTPYFYALARVSADGLNYVWARAYCVSFGNYKADIGYTVGGVEQTPWVTGISLTWALDMRFTAGVGTNARQYQIWSGDKVVYTHTESGTSSKLCSLSHANPADHTTGCTKYRQWGAIAQVRNQRVAGKVSATNVSDNGTPSVNGSTARMTRNGSTGGLSTSANSTAYLTSSFFDTVAFESQDIDADTANGTMKVSITKPYNIVGRAAWGTGPACTCTLVLQRSTDNGSNWSTVQWGDDVYASNNEAVRGNWLQYLNAGDMVRLAVVRAIGGVSQTLVGESTGAKTYFAITGFDLDNDV